MAKKKKGSKDASSDNLGDPKDEYLSLFIRDGEGEIVGESIGVEGRSLIFKKGTDFHRIPLSAVKLEGQYLTLIRKVNWRSSGRKGERWRKKQLDPLYEGAENG